MGVKTHAKMFMVVAYSWWELWVIILLISFVKIFCQRVIIFVRKICNIIILKEAKS